MTKSEFKLAKDMVWDKEFGEKITADPELSESLKQDLIAVGVSVIRVGRKPKSKSKFILFTISAYKVKGMELKFLSPEDAQNWQTAKNKGLNTLMKAPDEAFTPVETELVEETIYWSQAMALAYRLGSPMTHSKENILKKRGAFVGQSFGI